MDFRNLALDLPTGAGPDVGVAVLLLAVLAVCWLLFRPRGLPVVATL